MTAAMLDSGVDLSHPALRGRIAQYVHRYEAGHPIAVSARDIVGHGTHVAGILNALYDPTLGVEGISPCRLTMLKVFGDRMAADPAAHAKVFLVEPVLYHWALEECLARHFDVVNLSLGGRRHPIPHEAAILRELLTRRTTLVAAMGNGVTGLGQPYYPAASPGVIAVGAVGPDDLVAPFSRRGKHIAPVRAWSRHLVHPAHPSRRIRRPDRPDRRRASSGGSAPGAQYPL